jgi:hypothetical protein
MKKDPIDSAFAEASLQFARAAIEGDWRNWDDVKSDPPWFSEGVKWIWAVLEKHTAFWRTLRPTNYLEPSREYLTHLAGGVFDCLLVDHEKSRCGKLGLSPEAKERFIQQAKERFIDVVRAELLPRVSERMLSASASGGSTSSAQRPSRPSTKDAATASAPDSATHEQIEDTPEPSREPHPLPQSKEERKAERKALRDAYKAECKAAGVKVTDEMIGRAANSDWKDGRTAVQKWVACDQRYDGEADRLIRRVLTEKPHLRRKG